MLQGGRLFFQQRILKSIFLVCLRQKGGKNKTWSMLYSVLEQYREAKLSRRKIEVVEKTSPLSHLKQKH